jgi:sulfite exporter TauE/SafE/copper chaperone CopZ
MENNTTCSFSVAGMHCDSCELYIESVVKKQAGIKRVTANSQTQVLQIEFDEGINVEETTKKINEIIKPRGYSIVTGQSGNMPTEKQNLWRYVISLALAAALTGLFFIAQKLNVASFFTAEKLTYPSLFMLGVIASLTSCMAVVGGLVLSLSSSLESRHQRKGIIAFHIARLAGFAVLGGLTGALGRMVVINGFVADLMKVVVALLMIIIALDMLGIKLPKVVLPKQLSDSLDIFSDKEGATGAVVLGISTFFLPCAFTQSIQLYTLSTGSIVEGALTMFVFALGTLPALALLSFGSVVSIEKLKSSIFQYVMAFLMIMLAVYNVLAAIGVLAL